MPDVLPADPLMDAIRDLGGTVPLVLPPRPSLRARLRATARLALGLGPIPALGLAHGGTPERLATDERQVAPPASQRLAPALPDGDAAGCGGDGRHDADQPGIAEQGFKAHDGAAAGTLASLPDAYWRDKPVACCLRAMADDLARAHPRFTAWLRFCATRAEAMEQERDELVGEAWLAARAEMHVDSLRAQAIAAAATGVVEGGHGLD